MKLKAFKDNKTLHITKDNEYVGYTIGVGSTLVIVENDIGDEVVMSKYNFEEISL